MDNHTINHENQNNDHLSSNKTILLIVIAVIIALAVVIFSVLSTQKSKSNSTTSTSNQSAPAVVTITGSGFSPATITIKPNQSVQWVNNDKSLHLVATDPYPSDNGLAGFKGGSLSTNDSYIFKFNKAGNYPYHDDLSPYKYKGEVIVK